MECYYHPDRESSENCAICGKSICKECGLEIAGKTYCKECLEKIVGLGIENKTPSESRPVENHDAYEVEPSRVERGPISETIYESHDRQVTTPTYDNVPNQESKYVRDDSPYNIHNTEPVYTSQMNEPPLSRQLPNEYNMPNEYIPQNKLNSQDYIYPEHSDEVNRSNLEDKYERYLDDLYFDENELPLEEQLAKDEEQYGSLTRRPYQPRTEEALLREKQAEERKKETPEEMEARIRAEILAEKNGKNGIRDSNIHNLNYKEEKEPMNVVDIILTVVLVIVILIVIYYLLYVFILNSAYPTFMDALFGITNPQNVINNLLNPTQV